MTHRDGFPRFSARSAWRGDAGHREPRATLPAPGPESRGKPPFRSRGRTAGVRRAALTMPRIARGSPPARRIAHAISMGHFYGSLVLGFLTPSEDKRTRPRRRLPVAFRRALPPSCDAGASPRRARLAENHGKPVYGSLSLTLGMRDCNQPSRQVPPSIQVRQI